VVLLYWLPLKVDELMENNVAYSKVASIVCVDESCNHL
jgi:hypothetical protein